MLNGLIGQGHVIVSNGHSSMPYISPGAPSSGMVRYMNNNFEIYDGSSWQILSAAYPIVDLTGTANSAINWAMKKMTEEAELEKLAKEHPAIKAAYDNMLKAAEQLKTTIILSKDDKTTS
jgi:hypothetical protein